MSDSLPVATNRAVLVGVSDYEHRRLANLPAAGNSVEEMYKILTSAELGGWPREWVTVLRNPGNAGALGSQLATLAQSTQGVFLLYYVGHGVIAGSRRELHLTASGTDPKQAVFTGLPWPALAEALAASPARVRIMILDCCFSGRALDVAVLGAEQPQLADLTEVEGVYTLTASTRNALATTPDPAEQASACTHFTGELSGLVREGLPDLSSWLTLGDLYPVLAARLVGKQLPRPDQRNHRTAALFPFTRNAAIADLPVTTQLDPSATVLMITARRLLVDLVKTLFRAIRIALRAASAQAFAEELAKPAERAPVSGGVFSRLKQKAQDQVADGIRATSSAGASVSARYLRERRDTEIGKLKETAAELVVAIGQLRTTNQDSDDGLAQAQAHAVSLSDALNTIEGRDLATTSVQVLAKSHLRGVNVGFRASLMDVSGMDLSGLEGITWRNLGALRGLIWTERTLWPPDVAGLIREQSLELRPGIFQIGYAPTTVGLVDIDKEETEAKAEAETD